MGNFISEKQLGRLLCAPVNVYLDDYNMPQPDVLFISSERQTIINADLCRTPDLVVEIISPTSAARDRVEKLKLYERCGVKEYWLIELLSGFRLSLSDLFV